MSDCTHPSQRRMKDGRLECSHLGGCGKRWPSDEEVIADLRAQLAEVTWERDAAREEAKKQHRLRADDLVFTIKADRERDAARNALAEVEAWEERVREAMAMIARAVASSPTFELRDCVRDGLRAADRPHPEGGTVSDDVKCRECGGAGHDAEYRVCSVYRTGEEQPAGHPTYTEVRRTIAAATKQAHPSGRFA